MTPKSGSPDCAVCDLLDGPEPTKETWLIDEPFWFACVYPGIEVPGWVVCGLRRHAEGPDSLNAEEAGSLGFVLRRLATAIRSATQAERVYTVAFGEASAHWHFMLVPRAANAPPERRGPSLILDRKNLIDMEGTQTTAVMIRKELSDLVLS